MKRLGITQRVAVIEAYGERRDCLDQRWSELALALGYLPIPLPNLAPDKVADLLRVTQLDAIVLSGGNSLSRFVPDGRDKAPERDVFESALIDMASGQGIPILGVCRGLQIINAHFGGTLEPITGHAGTRHDITILDPALGSSRSVNSYHDWTIPNDGLAPGLVATAFDEAGHVEAFKHPDRSIAAIMWHPERETPQTGEDLEIVRKMLQ